MSPKPSRRKKRRAKALRVPIWYYALLGGIALIGIALLVISGQYRAYAGGATDEGDYFKGRADAPITIIDWSNFQCGYCLEHVRVTIPLLEEAYIETGRVRYIHRPMVFEETGQRGYLAAEALYCAGEAGRFWEMHDWLFFNVDRWGAAPDVVSAIVQESAPELGLDGAALESCLREERYRGHVEALAQDARARGVTGTPSFLVGDQLLHGWQPFDQFKAIIEGERLPPELALGVAIGLPAVLGLFVAGGGGPVVDLRVFRLRMIAVALALCGLLVALYLSLYELQVTGALVCPDAGCETVNQSEYVAILFNIPIALIGVAGYATILALVLGRLKRRLVLGAPVGSILLGLTGFGFLVSLVLTGLEILVIRAICTWCLVSTVLMTALFVLSLVAWLAERGGARGRR